MLFVTRTPIEDKIRYLFDERIKLTSNSTWDKRKVRSPSEVQTTHASAIYLTKVNIPTEYLRVCVNIKMDVGYITNVLDYIRLAGISTALTDKTLLPRSIDNIKVANNASQNCYCDTTSEFLLL